MGRSARLILILPIIAISFFGSTAAKRIVATGDIHADLLHAYKALHFADLIAERSSAHNAPLTAKDFRWTAGEDTVWVQTGDLVDRGKDTYQVYESIEKLRETAGENIHSLLGNHEYMNAVGDWRYVNPDDVKHFGSIEKRAEAFSSRGWIGRAWLEHYRVAAIVDWKVDGFEVDSGSSASKDPTFGESQNAAFVHGGLHADWTNLTEVNEIGLSFLSKALDGNDVKNETLWTRRERQFYSEKGPLWYRGFSILPETAEEERRLCAEALVSMRKLRVQMLIMGHTPSITGIQTLCDERVVLIDTGLSSVYGGRISSLEISSRVVEGVLHEDMTAMYGDSLERVPLWQRRRKGRWVEAESRPSDREL